ncbi:MAG: MASE1 domain-containing protein [Acidimicrobiia bacterium]|nr:MASE1 domain-containing protein [Acidimicrobiia bacterium]
MSAGDVHISEHPGTIPKRRRGHGRTVATVITRRTTAIGVLCYVVGYLAAVEWAVSLDAGDSILVWFPAAGIAVGAFALVGPRLYPLAVATEMVSTAWITEFGPAFGIGWNLVNALVIVGAYALAGSALRAAAVDPGLRTLRDVLWLLALGVVAGPTLAAVGGVAVQVAIDLVDGSDALAAFGRFWAGDVIGVATVTPVVLIVGGAALAGRPAPFSDRTSGVANGLALAEYTTPTIVGVVLFAASDPPTRFLFLLIAPILVIAVRHGVTGAALLVAGHELGARGDDERRGPRGPRRRRPSAPDGGDRRHRHRPRRAREPARGRREEVPNAERDHRGVAGSRAARPTGRAPSST